MRLAFGRLEKALNSVGAKLSETVMTHMYPLSSAAAECRAKGPVRILRCEEAAREHAPRVRGACLRLDALFGMEVVTKAGQT